jgi:hypothetical protein
MANEIQFPFRIGATLTYGAYEPDGTVRTAAGTSLPEIAATGYFTATDASIVAGDAVVVKEGANVVGGGIYQPEVTSVGLSGIGTVTDRIAAIQESDKVLDVAAGTLSYNTKGTSTTILKKNLKDPDGNAVNSTEDIIAEEEDTTP